MYCARCGRSVGAGDDVCPGCGAELWESGALRMTSAREPVRNFTDVFPEATNPPRVTLFTVSDRPDALSGGTSGTGSRPDGGEAPGRAGEPAAAGVSEPTVGLPPADRSIPSGSWAAFDRLRSRHAAPDRRPAMAGTALRSTGSAPQQHGPDLRQRGAGLLDPAARGAAITSLPALAQVTTRARTAQDSLALHRRNQVVMAVCLLAVALATAMMVYGARLIQRVDAFKLSPVGGAASKARVVKKKATVAPTPTPTPEVEEDTTNRASTLPGSAKECTTTVGASQATSCGLATAVQKALPRKPSGRFTVTAVSPVSGTSYDFTCSADRMVVCSRGNTVRVYILY
ncbi:MULTISPECIES: hypothetical protein [unclassified Luteococcus]|uniref:hypothetical protein n=1 Tax=unclassified Luteococcus TaxID=2639923 RepID=UPI00313E500B